MRRILFTSLLALSLTACGGGSGPDGLYIMTRMWSGNLEIASYRFDDGNVVRNPLLPGDSVDVEGEGKLHPQDVGTYGLDGDQLTMTFGSSKSSGKFEPNDDCFGFDGAIWCPVEAFEGDTIEGTFEGGTSARTSGGLAIASRTMTFDDDGNYTTATAGSVSSSTSESTASGGSSGGERGTYRIDGNVMVLEPEGGEAQSITVFPWDDGSEGEQPRRMYFGGTMLKRSE